MQAVGSDGGVALHTRSTRYGRLSRGQLVKVPPRLVPRLKSHFCPLTSHGVDVLLGCNGWLWVGVLPQGAAADPMPTTDAEAAVAEAASAARPDDAPDVWFEAADAPVSKDEREQVNRIAAAVSTLARLGRLVTPAAVVDVADAAMAWGILSSDMEGAAFLQRLMQRFAELQRVGETEAATTMAE